MNALKRHVAATTIPAKMSILQISHSDVVKSLGIEALFHPRGAVARGGTSYDNATIPHVVAFPTKEMNPFLVVHLPGTASLPTGCLHYIKTSASIGYPTIALSYEWAHFADLEKNAACEAAATPELCQEQLEAYHKDVCFGGDSSNLTAVHVSSSVKQRLIALLLHLSKISSEKEFWRGFLIPQSEVDAETCAGLGEDNYDLKWSSIVFTGHSQGSGHAAYLAKVKSLRGAVLFSGPQEGGTTCVSSGTKHWLQGPFATRRLSAFRHEFEEGTAALIDSCWRLMDCFDGEEPEFIRNEEDALQERFSSRLLVSRIAPMEAANQRPNHNSTVNDSTTPMMANGDDEPISLYSVSVWKQLLSLSLSESAPN